MTASDVAADRPIEPDEAIKQIAYIRDLLESTKLRLATAYPLFLMWGVFWVIGYVGGRWVETGGPRWLEWRWILLNATGAFAMILWGVRYGRPNPRATTTLERQIFWLMVSLFLGFMLLPLAIGGGRIFVNLNTYLPYCIGMGYIVVGIFLGREMYVIGAWIAACAAASAFIPDNVHWLWFAVNGGGGLIVTGLLLRRQLHRS